MLNLYKVIKELQKYGDVGISLSKHSSYSPKGTEKLAISVGVIADNGTQCGPLEISFPFTDEREVNAAIDAAVRMCGLQLIFNLTGKVPDANIFD